VPSGKPVQLVFTELALGSCEFNCSSGNCTYVELYDGSSANSSSLGRFCNGSALPEVISSGNQMFVIFHSGASLDRGFEAQYSMFSTPTTTTTATTTTFTTIKPSTTAKPKRSESFQIKFMYVRMYVPLCMQNLHRAFEGSEQGLSFPQNAWYYFLHWNPVYGHQRAK